MTNIAIREGQNKAPKHALQIVMHHVNLNYYDPRCHSSTQYAKETGLVYERRPALSHHSLFPVKICGLHFKPALCSLS